MTDKIPENWHYKKIISQELKHISPSCKKSIGKPIQFCYSTITLPLSSYKQSSSIFCQSFPFRKVSPKVLPHRWHLHLSMSFQNMANHISMQSMFRSLSIGHWPERTSCINWEGFNLSSNIFRHKKFGVTLCPAARY